MNTVLNSRMLSDKEAAAFLGVSVSTLGRWRSNRIGPAHFRFGKILRYPQSALEEFREKHTKRNDQVSTETEGLGQRLRA